MRLILFLPIYARGINNDTLAIATAGTKLYNAILIGWTARHLQNLSKDSLVP
jgi:hypothetical protein